MINSKIIKIDQAFYGELEQGHGCLCSTLEDISMKAHLTAFTDRPGFLSAGTELKPYYSGMQYDNKYVFTLTFPDESATRAGIVFTHALIIDLEDLGYINNLECLFALFCKEIPENKTYLEELYIEKTIFNFSECPKLFPEFIFKSIRRLSNGILPVIFCGDSKSFIILITSLWGGLSKTFRRKFSFTAGFMVSNIDSTKTFIHFQKDLIDALRNIDFVSDSDSKLIGLNSTIEQYLLNPHQSVDFEEFLTQLNVNVNNWEILNLSAKAYEGYSVFLELDKDALKQLIRQVAKISSNNQEGIEIKENLISELARKIGKREETNLKSLRNLPLKSYILGEDKIGKAIQAFIINEFDVYEKFDFDLINDILIIGDSEVLKNWWHESVIDGLLYVIKSKTARSFNNLWKLILSSEVSANIVWNLIPSIPEYENLFIKFLPSKIPTEMAEKLAIYAINKQWTILHAYLILAFLSPKEAIIKQYFIEKENKNNEFEGAKIIIGDVSDSDCLAITLEFNEEFFLKEYVKRALKNAILLKDLDIQSNTWLNIWEKSLEETNDITFGIINLSEKIKSLFNKISLGEYVPGFIVKKIAESQYADISTFENRAQIWTNIDFQIRNLFLDATSNSILKDISTLGLSGVVLEMELIQHIKTDRFLTSFLDKNKRNINSILEVYENIAGLKDRFLADYIRYFSGSLKDMQSEHLGNLIKSNGFTLSAKQIFEKAKDDNSYRIGLEKCKSLLNLGFLDRLFYGHLFGERITTEDIYMALTELCIELYPQGPEDRELWQRSGGDVSKLYQNKSREDNWRRGIQLLRNGGGGKNISLNSLLKTMEEDYSKNTQLKHLIKVINLK